MAGGLVQKMMKGEGPGPGPAAAPPELPVMPDEGMGEMGDIMGGEGGPDTAVGSLDAAVQSVTALSAKVPEAQVLVNRLEALRQKAEESDGGSETGPEPGAEPTDEEVPGSY